MNRLGGTDEESGIDQENSEHRQDRQDPEWPGRSAPTASRAPRAAKSARKGVTKSRFLTMKDLLHAEVEKVGNGEDEYHGGGAGSATDHGCGSGQRERANGERDEEVRREKNSAPR